ncbi:hypothetical protein ZWY2020_001336 [Hordeum vulgare]|nr:hypothetical protein ZWY2020_001336 [Hordeum vulgare]
MPLPSSAMAKEHAGGGKQDQRVAAERRARRKLSLSVPILPIVMFIVASCALFLFTADFLALPRIRIDYPRLDGAREAPATNEPPVPSERGQPLRQLTDRPYSLGPNVLMVTGSSPRRCKEAEGDHVLLRAFKNKADYCRVHGLDIFYSNAVLDGEMTGFWTKLPLLRALMVAHPEAELLWWVDSDAVFTDMLFELPWGRYAGHNLVLHGRDDEVYGARSWLGANTGSFVLRNCRWSLDLLDAWARMGPRGPVRDRYGRVFAAALSDQAPWEADDQSALVYLLVTERGRWGQGHGRALNFADDQILGLYGFQHESLGTMAVQRVRNDTGRPLDAGDEEIGLLLHPEFRAAANQL